jgi:hypothetical protein
MIKWEGEKFEDYWRCDGYCWRQQRSKVDYTLQKKMLFSENSEDFKHAERQNLSLTFSRITFKLRINCGETAESFTTKFTKKSLYAS